ncbi:RHS repeat-associated core domain-containing protein [Isoalcanivorax indicus]|uniref:RHS repeat-associated core domain-containing protein n=1 Tax=Isoalcanivorax indicus TaxID=2202653 RepID=UPI000DB978E0|nr:RHS repeat-associated core domain-containing protein [Isoalcanivorax indicus]
MSITTNTEKREGIMRRMTLKGSWKGWLGSICLLVAAPLYAAPGIEHDFDVASETRNGLLRMEAQDIRVKVMGGYLHSSRTWIGGRWEFNRRWAPVTDQSHEAQVQIGSVLLHRPGIVDDLATTLRNGVFRAGFGYYPLPGSVTEDNPVLYRTQNPGTGSSGVNYADSLRREGDLLRWRGPNHDTMDYDLNGQTQAFADRYGNRNTLHYDSAGNLVAVRDTFDKVILTFEYESVTFQQGEGVSDVYHRPVAVEDYTGRRVSYHYDSDHRLVRVNDVLGHDWLYAYNSQGHITSVTDPEGRASTIEVNDAGLMTRLVNPDGHATRFSNSGEADTFIQIRREPDGRTVETRYNALGAVAARIVNGETEFSVRSFLSDGEEVAVGGAPAGLYGDESTRAERPANIRNSDAGKPAAYLARTERTDRYGETLTTWFDERRNVIRRHRSSDGAEQHTQWHPVHHQRTRHTDWDGTVSTWEYDEHGALTRQVLAADTSDEQVTTYTRDSHGQLLSVLYRSSGDTPDALYVYEYDDHGNRIRITAPDNEVTAFVHPEHGGFDALGNPSVYVDARGPISRYEYDAAGKLLGETDPLDRITEHHYNTAGDKTGMTLPNGATSQWEVDGAGRPLSITDALGHKTVFEYDENGRMLGVRLPSGAMTQQQYDAEGRLAQETDASGNSIRYHYDGERLTAVDYPTYSEAFTLDEMGRITRIDTTSEIGQISQTRRVGYDTAGNPVTELDAEGLETVTSYDALQRPIRMVDAIGGMTRLEFDARDNLIAVTDPEGSTTTFTYDAHGRLSRETRPGGETRDYTYYPGGLRKSEINGMGQITHYSYDDAGQLIAVNYYASPQAKDQNTPGRTSSFEYNALGLLTAYSDQQDGSTVSSGSYAYDLLGRVTEVTVNYGPFSKTHSYTYDQDGRKATYTNPEGVTYTYTWTPDGDFQSLTIPGEGTIAVTEYQWRTPIETVYPGGTRIRHDVDGLLRPGTTELLDAADTPRAYRSYQYNSENHIVRIDSETGEHLYTYDELYRLIEARFAEDMGLQNESYTYDGVANRLTEGGGEPWEYNENHQLISKPGATFEYDANGHTVRKVEQDGTVTLYEYDLAERLRQVRIEGGAILGSYRYDPFGRRVSKTTQEGTIYFHYDDSGLLAEYDDNGSLIAEYQYWPNSMWMTDPLFRRDGEDYSIGYYYAGHIGQPLKLFGRGGEVIWGAYWQAFGSVEIYIEKVSNPIRFPGQYYDEEKGLLYNFHREYSGSLGRYMQSDPIGIGGGVNYYIYAESNPISRFDDDGMRAKPWDHAVYPPTHNCSCMENCMKSESSGSALCNLIPGKEVKPFGIPIQINPAKRACQVASKGIKCDMECSDFCRCECPPCGDSPYPD